MKHTTNRESSIVTFTESKHLNSTAVGDVFYDANDEDLVLELHGVLYRYKDVPFVIYSELVSAESAGRYYRDVVRSYGPAERLGTLHQVEFVEVEDEDVPNVAALNNNTIYVTPPVREGKGESGLYTTADTNGNFNLNTNTLQIRTPAPSNLFPPSKHKVTFEVDGTERQHTLKVNSVDEAVEQMHEIADMLGLTFKIKEVTVYFE